MSFKYAFAREAPSDQAKCFGQTYLEGKEVSNIHENRMLRPYRLVQWQPNQILEAKCVSGP